MTIHRMKVRREPFRSGSWAFAFAFALAFGFSVTFQNNRLRRIYIARLRRLTPSVWLRGSTGLFVNFSLTGVACHTNNDGYEQCGRQGLPVTVMRRRTETEGIEVLIDVYETEAERAARKP